MSYSPVMHPITILSLLAGAFVYAGAQTVYIDIDTGKIVGIEPGKSNQGNIGNQRRNQEWQRPQQPQSNYQPTYPNQHRPHYHPQHPYYHPQPPQGDTQGGRTNPLNTEWVCRDPKTGNTVSFLYC